VTRVGLIGTGMLGNAVGLHLIESGYKLTVFNRTKSKTQNLEKLGAIVVDSPKDVAELSDLVITVVKDANQLHFLTFLYQLILL